MERVTLDLTKMDDLTEFLRNISVIENNVYVYTEHGIDNAKNIEVMLQVSKDYPVTIEFKSNDKSEIDAFYEICNPYEVHEGVGGIEDC